RGPALAIPNAARTFSRAARRTNIATEPGTQPASSGNRTRLPARRVRATGSYRKLPEFRGDSQFGSWVYRIAANFALMRIRHQRVVDQVEEPLDLMGDRFKEDGRWAIFPTGLWARRADKVVLDGELREKLVRAVEGLPELHRAVFMLRDVEGLSYEEIAQALETTVSAVK